MSDGTRAPGPIPIGIHHVAISVGDLSAMSAWYREVLDFSVEASFRLPGGHARGEMLRRSDGIGLELLCHDDSTGSAPADPPAAMRLRGYGHWALAVDDVGSVHARLTGAGAREVWSPRPAPPPAAGRMSFLADPEGNLLELVGP
jgi:lactoylglutathione lyase